MKIIAIWSLFVVNCLGISSYLLAAALNKIEPPKYFLYILITYGIFTLMVFGDLILKPKHDAKRKTNT